MSSVPPGPSPPLPSHSTISVTSVSDSRERGVEDPAVVALPDRVVVAGGQPAGQRLAVGECLDVEPRAERAVALDPVGAGVLDRRRGEGVARQRQQQGAWGSRAAAHCSWKRMSPPLAPPASAVDRADRRPATSLPRAPCGSDPRRSPPRVPGSVAWAAVRRRCGGRRRRSCGRAGRTGGRGAASGTSSASSAARALSAEHAELAGRAGSVAPRTLRETVVARACRRRRRAERARRGRPCATNGWPRAGEQGDLGLRQVEPDVGGRRGETRQRRSSGAPRRSGPHARGSARCRRASRLVVVLEAFAPDLRLAFGEVQRRR